MSEVTARLGRTFGTAALYAIGIPMIVIGNAARIVNRGVRYRRASVQEDDGAPAVDAASAEAFFCGPVLRHRRSPVLASRLGESMRQRAFIVALGSAAAWPLTACAPAAMGPVTYFADPGQYEYFSCGLLAERRKFWAERELELKLLMDKSEQSSGGVFINVIAYKGDHIAALEEIKVIDATRRAKQCDGLR